MVGFDTIFQAVLPIFLLILIGWFMRHRGGLTQEGEHNLMRLVVNLLYPVFILEFVLGNERLKDGVVLFEAGLAGFLTVTVGCLVSYFAAPLFRLKEDSARRTFSIAAGLHNFGYMAIPVIALCFGPEAVGVMLVVNTGVDFAIWTVGVMTVTGGFDLKAIRRAINPPLVALFSAVTLNFLDAEALLPEFIVIGIGMLAPCAIPIGLIMVGTAFYGLTSHLKGFGYWRISLGAITLRQGILPAIILLAAGFLPLSTDVRHVLLVHAAMPAAVFPIILAKFYGGNTITAIQAVIPSALLGFVTIPLWIQVGFWWLE